PLTAVALGPGHGTHQVLMTARDQAAGTLVVRREPLEEPFVPSGETLCGQRGPLFACGECATGGWHVAGGQGLGLPPRGRGGQVRGGAALQDDDARELRDHHAGGGPLWRLLVPPRPGGGRWGQRTCAWPVPANARAAAPSIPRGPRPRCVPTSSNTD